MPVATSVEAFPDCREFLNRAAESEKGWRARFREKGTAINFRLRCYTARKRELTFNRKYYRTDDVMHNRTAWDGLVLLVREVEGEWEVIAAKDGSALLSTQLTWQGPVE